VLLTDTHTYYWQIWFNSAFIGLKTWSLPVENHEDSEGRWNEGYPSLLWHSVQQLGQQNFHFGRNFHFGPIYPKGTSSMLIYFRCPLAPIVAEWERKEYVTWKFSRTLPGIENVICKFFSWLLYCAVPPITTKIWQFELARRGSPALHCSAQIGSMYKLLTNDPSVRAK